MIYQYLRAAAQAKLARMKRRVIGQIETVEFANKSRKISCYDKERETEHLFKRGKTTAEAVETAHGILRLEVRYNTTAAVKRLCEQLNLSDIEARTLLNFSVAESVLQAALKSLGLHAPVISIDGRLNKLRETYGFGSRFQRLAGFLYLGDVYGFERLIEIGIVKRSAYYKQRKELLDASALVFSNFHTTLPALRVR